MVVLRRSTIPGIEIARGTAAAHGVYLDTYALVAVLGGYLSLEYRRASQVARAGALILLEPGRTVIARSSDDPHACSIAVLVEPVLLESIAAGEGTRPVPISFHSAVVRGSVAESFAEAVRPVGEMRDGSECVDASTIAAIRAVVGAYGSSAQGRASASLMPTAQPMVLLALHRTACYLHAHVADPVSLDLLARVACTSKYHLTRLFHSCYGLPPHAYQLQLRLAFAKRLICRGLSVAAAARTAGFASAVHLHRHFRGRYGVAPGYYAADRREAHLTPEMLARLTQLPLRE